MKPYNLRLKKLYFLIGLVFWCSTINYAQKQVNSFSQVDKTTYSLYMKGDWNNLISVGENALKAGIDYFYLRMRIGYAYFMQEKYRNAIPHYKKALDLNNKNEDVLYYLLKSYEYSGRDNEALKLSSNFSSDILAESYNKYKTVFNSAGIFYSYSTSNNDDANKSIFEKFRSFEPGIQKTANYFHDIFAFTSHRLGKSIIAYHSLEYLSKSDYDFVVDTETHYHVENQPIYQLNYQLQFQINPFNGFIITPGINLLNVKIPSKHPRNVDIDESNTLFSLSAKQNFTKINLGASIFSGELYNMNNLQIGGHFTYYPKSNLNLYYSFDGYTHNSKYENTTKSSFIHKHTLGFKASNFWWIETSGMFSDTFNFFDFSNNALYNSLEKTQSSFNLKNTFISNNLRFILGIGLNKSSSEFLYTRNPLLSTNATTYNKLIISGGIIWKL